MSEVQGKIAIIGSGLIGRSWAMLFAWVGYPVYLYDVEETRIDVALAQISWELDKLEEEGSLRGTLSAAQQLAFIHKEPNLEACVRDAVYIQECVYEDLELKKKVFKELDSLVTSPDVVLASSTSCHPASTFTEELTHRDQVLVAHPVNPPYYVPLVEIIPSPWTKKSIISKAMELQKEIGQKPVLMLKETLGFALNRIQYAIIAESWRLVEDGIMSAEDVDTVMTDGLGMRYAFLGPLETAHLNAEGMREYCQKYGQGIYNVLQTFGPNPRLEGPTAEAISQDLERRVPHDELQERRAWRDSCLAKLAKLKSNAQ